MMQRYSVSREFSHTGMSALNQNVVQAVMLAVIGLLSGAVKVTIRQQTNTLKPAKAEDYGFAVAGVLR